MTFPLGLPPLPLLVAPTQNPKENPSWKEESRGKHPARALTLSSPGNSLATFGAGPRLSGLEDVKNPIYCKIQGEKVGILHPQIPPNICQQPEKDLFLNI